MRKALLMSTLSFALLFTGCSNSGKTGAAITDEPATNMVNNVSTNDEGEPPLKAETPAETEIPSDLPAAAGSELTVAMLGEYNTYLDTAIERYKAVNPDVHIELAGYPWDEAAFSQSINTAIMSGGGDDIIDVSMLTWQKLADKGKLVDLNEYLAFSDEEFYQNILDAYLYKGKRYTLPVSFSFNAFGFMDKYQGVEPAGTLTPDALFTLAEEYPDAKLFNNYEGLNGPLLANLLMQLDFNEYLNIEDKTVNVNNERFVSLLNNAMTLSDSMAAESGGDTILRYYSIERPELCTWIEVINGEGDNPIASSSGGSIDYSNVFLLVNDKGQGVLKSTAGVGIMPAINVNNAHHQVAADFVSFLLSPEMQSSPEIIYTPVSRKANAMLTEAAMEQFKAGMMTDGFDFEKNVEVFNDLINHLSICKTNDSQIQNFILEELRNFFNRSQTAEQAAENLQSRLSMYLNE
jgi:ABC-type glycerol-3-phosphate transport system substrate-binding protein